DDLPELVSYFLARAAEETGRTLPSLADATWERLRGYQWPGNVRELQNVIYRAFGVCRGPQVLPAHLDFPAHGAGPSSPGDGSDDEAVAALHKAIAWAWNSDRQKLWPLLRDLLERELLKHALAKLG